MSRLGTAQAADGPGSALVVGAGASGRAAAGALGRAGARVVVVDAGADPTLAERLAEAAPGADVELGAPEAGAEADPDAAASLLARVDPELVVASPGVPERAPLLRGAGDAGVEVVSEPELAWRLGPQRWRLIGVTGTNGKTTTTTLVGRALGVPAAGNIGEALCDLVVREQVPATVAVELSSFQLRFCSTLRPRVACLLNVAADHLDWHADPAGYAAAKAGLWAAQRPDDHLVVGDDAGAEAAVAAHPPAARVVRSGADEVDPPGVGVRDGVLVADLGDEPVALCAVDQLPAAGPPARANAAAAAACALLAGAAPEQVADALRATAPGPHRLAEVGWLAGARWVDDSKATNPHAAAAALRAFDRVVWIAGGLAKGVDLAGEHGRALRDAAADRVRLALTVGRDGDRLAGLAEAAGCEAVRCGTLEQAVRTAAARAEPGETVLLSPACASQDQFADYAERGRAFARLAGAAGVTPARQAPRGEGVGR